MTPDRTAPAIQARRLGTQQKLQHVRDAIATIRRARAPVTYPAVARHAGVSRTFLYANPDARALVSQAISKSGSPPGQAMIRSRPGGNAPSTPRRHSRQPRPRSTPSGAAWPS